MKRTILKIIGGYQKLSLMLWRYRPPIVMYSSCRFYPSCSQYAGEAVRKYGAVRGSVRAVGRILRCNPLFRAGMDHA